MSDYKTTRLINALKASIGLLGLIAEDQNDDTTKVLIDVVSCEALEALFEFEQSDMEQDHSDLEQNHSDCLLIKC